MKTSICLLLASVLATVAIAGLDQNPDSFGVYFDLMGNTNSNPQLTPTTRSVYILLMNPTTQIQGFELAYEIFPGSLGSPYPLGDDLVRISQVIAGDPWVDQGSSIDPVIGDFRCVYASPRPIVPAMLMVTWKLRYYGVEDTLWFCLRGVATNPSPESHGFPVLDGGAGIGLRQATVLNGSVDGPVASAGDGIIISEEISSFGSVKSLYR